MVAKKKKKQVRIDIISTDQKDIFTENDSRDSLEKEDKNSDVQKDEGLMKESEKISTIEDNQVGLQ